MRTILSFIFLTIMVSLCFRLQAQTSDPDAIIIPVSAFSENNSTCGADTECWDILRFPKAEPTRYRRITENGDTLIEASSNGQASGLVYRTSIAPETHPILEWTWKIESSISSGDMMKKEGDDYPARIFITFEFDKKDLPLGQRVRRGLIKTFTSYEVPTRALNYVWSSRHQAGTTTKNAFTEWVVMISVESGDQNAGTWVTHRVDIYDDYIQAFGEAPGKVTGIAIMTDTDNTGSRAKAWYKAIRFLPAGK